MAPELRHLWWRRAVPLLQGRAAWLPQPHFSRLRFCPLSAKRGYAWNNDDLWRNFLIAAYATGGSKWLARLKEHYAEKCKGVARYSARLDEIVAEARELAQADHEWIEERAVLSLDEIITRDSK